MNGTQLLERLQEHKTRSVDVIAPVSKTYAKWNDEGGNMDLIINGLDPGKVNARCEEGHAGAGLHLSPIALAQVREYAGIRKDYMDRSLAADPHFAALTTNFWLSHTAQTEKKEPRRRRLLRTYDGTIRAFLSSRYRIIDHLDVLSQSVPRIMKRGGKVWKADLTERRMYAHFVSEELVAELGGDAAIGNGHYFPKIHKLIASLTISNSEVGLGGFRVDLGAVIAACTNLAISLEGMYTVHLGRETPETADQRGFAWVSDNTRKLEDQLTVAKVNDMIDGVFDKDNFATLVGQYRNARSTEVADPVLAIKTIGAKENIDVDMLLKHFMTEPEPSLFGVSQAITAAAKEAKGADEANDMQRLAGRLLAKNQIDFAKYLKSEKTEMGEADEFAASDDKE